MDLWACLMAAVGKKAAELKQKLLDPILFNAFIPTLLRSVFLRLADD